MNEIALYGCRADVLAGYLQAIGLLRVIAGQHDPDARLHWRGGRAVLTTRLDEADLADWLVDSYAPSPVVSPWNGGSGFMTGGSSPSAERSLSGVEKSTDERFAGLRTAIAAGRDLVDDAIGYGWYEEKKGRKVWRADRKVELIRLCRARLPDDAVAWLDLAATLTAHDLGFNPLAGTGGNFGRQDLSATFHRHLLTLIGPDAKRPRSAAWAQAALCGGEDVLYLRDTVGQYDPGRAGGIHSTTGTDVDGFANPWSFVLGLEGALCFAGAATRRLGAGTRSGGAFPFFTTRPAPFGYGSAADAESAKGEQWVPLWPRPATLAEVEQVLGEGRARWRGRQAVSGLEFALAVAGLGVDRGITCFQRFAVVERLGQNPLAVSAGSIEVSPRPEERLLRGPHDWIDRIHRSDHLPQGITAAVNEARREMFSVARGDGGALRRFIIAFGRLHEAVGRSGRLRDKVSPYAGRGNDWLKHLAAESSREPELWIAAGFAGLTDTVTSKRSHAPDPALALRALLTRVIEVRDKPGRPRLAWTDSPGTGLELDGATLIETLAAAHRRRMFGAVADQKARARSAQDSHDAEAWPTSAYRDGPLVPPQLVEDFAMGSGVDDHLVADHLRGLLALGCGPRTSATRTAAAARAHDVALSALLPFFDTPDNQALLRPRPDWIGRLIAGGPASIADDVLLQLRIAGHAPVVTAASIADSSAPGPRLAAALLLRPSGWERRRALERVSATATETTTPDIEAEEVSS